MHICSSMDFMQVEPARQISEKGGITHLLARVLISLFFMDCCLADYQNWQFYQTPLMKSRVASYPQRYKDPGVPPFASTVHQQ